MSQIIKNLASGPVPPAVATSYVTDDGTAIPALNILNVNGLDSIENNANGILTRANPNLSNNLEVILSNRISVTAITSDVGGQTQTVALITPLTATSITFTALISGIDTINNESIGGEQIGLARTFAGIVTVIGINDTFDESDAALNTADWNVVSTSPTLSIQFVGIAGKTINWRALFEYTQAP